MIFGEGIVLVIGLQKVFERVKTTRRIKLNAINQIRQSLKHSLFD